MEQALRDAEMFRTFDGEGAPLFDTLDRTVLRGARPYLAALLRRPLRDAARLRRRQAALLSLASVAPAADAALAQLRRHEEDVRWFVRARATPPSPADGASLFFQSPWLAFLNRHAPALAAYNFQRIVLLPAVNLLSPLACIVAPYAMLRFKYGMAMPFAVYLRLLWRACAQGVRAGWLGGASVLLSVVFYFQNAFSVCEVARALHASMRTLTYRLRGVRAFAAVAGKLQDAVWAPCSAWFPGAPAPPAAPADDDWPSRRQSLRDFHAIDPAALEALLRRMCMADAVLSVLRARRALGMTLPSWTGTGTDTQLALHGFWHPAVPADRAVRNTLVMREGGGARSVVLTGANACGKSTLLKAVLTNALLAHTLGVCCAERATMTPLALISSSIQVSDRYGKESLFEAELARCSALLRGPSTPGLPRLVVVDELFSCTNPVEGVAAAYAVTEALAESPSTLSIVSTHFTYLATLPRRVPGCVNMCMKATVRDGDITYDYKLRDGVSRQYLALEIAAGREGLDPAVLRRAIETKKKFSVPHVRRP